MRKLENIEKFLDFTGPIHVIRSACNKIWYHLVCVKPQFSVVKANNIFYMLL